MSKLDLVEKITILLSTLTYICHYIRHNGSILPFFMLVYVLASATGSLAKPICYYRRNIYITCVYNLQIAPQKLIFQPMVNFLARLF